MIGAQYTGKQFSAAVMKSNQPAVVTHGGQDLLSIIAAVMLVAATLVICRRRYRGMGGLESSQITPELARLAAEAAAGSVTRVLPKPAT